MNRILLIFPLVAKQELVNYNLRLVVSTAKHYSGNGRSLQNLIQKGNLGLLKAADRFDYRQGFCFSTYATWWTRQSITRAIADNLRDKISYVDRMLDRYFWIRSNQRRFDSDKF